MVIEILACMGCSRTVDQFTMCYGCVECGGKLFKAIKPTKFRLLCWFFNDPKHVWKLILQDIRETYEKRRKHCNTDSSGS